MRPQWETRQSQTICDHTAMEDMIQCLKCKRWARELCAGVKTEKIQFFWFDCRVKFNGKKLETFSLIFLL